MNQAVDQVRRAESTRLKASSKEEAKRLKNMRWPLLRKGSQVRGKAHKKLNALLASKLATARAWELKEAFLYFRTYKSPLGNGLPRCLVRPRPAKPPRTHAESCSYAAQS
jgi:hypothetical protein